MRGRLMRQRPGLLLSGTGIAGSLSETEVEKTARGGKSLLQYRCPGTPTSPPQAREKRVKNKLKINTK